MLCHQLAEIFVGSDHQDFVEALPLGPCRGGSNHIVSLIALTRQDGDIERFDNLLDIRKTHLYGFGHSLAIGFVLGIHFMSESGFLKVKSYRHVGGPQLFHEVIHSSGEPQDSRSIHALGIHPTGAIERIVGTVNHCHAVKQN